MLSPAAAASALILDSPLLTKIPALTMTSAQLKVQLSFAVVVMKYPSSTRPIMEREMHGRDVSAQSNTQTGDVLKQGLVVGCHVKVTLMV